MPGLGETRTFAWLRAVGPVGHALGILPLVRLFSVQDLRDSLTAAGFAIGHEWLPGRNKVVFIVIVAARR